MRICINLATIHPRMTGVATFGRWIANIPQWVSTPHEFELLLHSSQGQVSLRVVPGHYVDPFVLRSERLGRVSRIREKMRRSKMIPEPVRAIWRKMRPFTGNLLLSPHAERKAWIDRHGFDVIHIPTGYPDPPPPHLANAAYCLNPHDYIWMRYPQFFTPGEVQRLLSMARQALAVSSVIFVVAEHIKADTVNYFGIKPERIHVVWPGPPFEGIPPISEALRNEVRKTYHLPPRFLFYPAITYEHKNHMRLLQALAIAKGRGLSDIQIVLSGAEGPFHESVMRGIQECGQTDSVRWLGYIPYAHVRALYTLADAVVMPSLYEASSGPVYEALAVGCPVACSTIANLPWLVDNGKAGLLFDPADVEAIADVLQRLWSDTELRVRLASAGLERMQAFSWRSFAEGYIRGYEQAAAERVC